MKNKVLKTFKKKKKMKSFKKKKKKKSFKSFNEHFSRFDLLSRIEQIEKKRRILRFRLLEHFYLIKRFNHHKGP